MIRHCAVICALALLTFTSAQSEHRILWDINYGTGNVMPIAVGDTVVWQWNDALEHSVNGLGVNVPADFGEDLITLQGHTYSFTFTQEGEVRFDCAVHGGQMAGTIVVGDGNDVDNCVLDGVTYQFCHCAALDFRIYWNINGANIEMVYDVPDDGWHALGFGSRAPNQQPMIGSNVVFGCADFVNSEGASRLTNVDYHLGDKSVLAVVPEGNQQLSAYAQERANGRCRVSFTRPLAPTVSARLDAAQQITDSQQTIVAARGGNILAQHAGNARLPFELNLITGAGADSGECAADNVDETETETETDDGNGAGNDNCVFKDEDFDFCFDVQDFNIFWTVKENSVDFLFDVPDNGWHAMGFSSRAATAQPMIGSNVVFGCADFVNSGDGTFQAQDYFLGDKAASQVNPAGNQQLVAHQQTIADGRCTVRFERLMEPPNLDEAQHIVDDVRTVIVASGGNDLSIHAERTPFEVNIIAGNAVIVDALDPVRVAHGSMMAIAFGLLFPLGILSAHHKKAIYKGKEACGLQIWFHVHRTCMPLAGLLSITGFIMILVHEREFYAETAHLAIGCVAMSLIFIQFSFVRLRPHAPKPGEAVSPERRRWNLAHWWNGRTAATFAFVNTVFGFTILEPPVGYFVFFFVVFGILAVTYIALEIAKCFPAKTRPSEKLAMDDRA